MRSYLPVARATYMIGLVYRFGFLFTIFGNLVYLGVAYYLWKSIYKYSNTIRGLTFNETFIYVALGSAIFILLKTYADWIIHYEIREGAIATYLTKPMDFQIYALFANLGSLLMNLTAITIPTALVMIFIFKVKVAFGVGLLLFPLSLLLAFLVSFSIDYFIGLLGFYSESVWGLSMTKEIIVTVLSGALIPLQFFPDAIQKVLFWLPFQAIFHTPIMMITRPNQGLSILLPMMLVQLGWAIILFILARLFYNQAIKVLRIAGG
ncbi:MAG TPA: ABC-2 family transporter protein [Anaerolineales bacterium]|nr:ABC-2 family transporter protein [Anaerolineales bacterium]